jgi:hypothetical protein
MNGFGPRPLPAAIAARLLLLLISLRKMSSERKLRGGPGIATRRKFRVDVPGVRKGNGHYTYQANSVRQRIRGTYTSLPKLRFYEKTQNQTNLTTRIRVLQQYHPPTGPSDGGATRAGGSIRSRKRSGRPETLFRDRGTDRAFARWIGRISSLTRHMGHAQAGRADHQTAVPRSARPEMTRFPGVGLSGC